MIVTGDNCLPSVYHHCLTRNWQISKTGALMKDKPKCDIRQVVLLRHGESIWNKENLFTGWTDVDLSDRGNEEAKAAGRSLKEHGFTFDIAFTSVLKRAFKVQCLLGDE